MDKTKIYPKRFRNVAHSAFKQSGETRFKKLILPITWFLAFLIAGCQPLEKKVQEDTVESLWSSKSIKERELYYKQQYNDRLRYWENQKAIKASPQRTNQLSEDNDAEIASVIVTASCAGKIGLMPRSQMGSALKKMFKERGIDATVVYSNWDYYWGIAKEMDARNQTYCIK